MLGWCTFLGPSHDGAFWQVGGRYREDGQEVPEPRMRPVWGLQGQEFWEVSPYPEGFLIALGPAVWFFTPLLVSWLLNSFKTLKLWDSLPLWNYKPFSSSLSFSLPIFFSEGSGEFWKDFIGSLSSLRKQDKACVKTIKLVRMKEIWIYQSSIWCLGKLPGIKEWAPMK